MARLLLPSASALRCFMQRRKLKLKAKFEAGPSYLTFKSMDPGSRRFQRGLDRVDLHRPTLMRSAAMAASYGSVMAATGSATLTAANGP
jgi:hypothetical protein